MREKHNYDKCHMDSGDGTPADNRLCFGSTGCHPQQPRYFWGASSIALIWGFSTLLVKVILNFPSVTSTGTVST